MYDLKDLKFLKGLKRNGYKKGFLNVLLLLNFKREGIIEFKDICIYLMNVVSCMF